MPFALFDLDNTLAGDAGPWKQQHLLSRAVWDQDALRGFTRRYAVAGLDDGGRGPGPGGSGALLVDETAAVTHGYAPDRRSRH